MRRLQAAQRGACALGHYVRAGRARPPLIRGSPPLIRGTGTPLVRGTSPQIGGSLPLGEDARELAGQTFGLGLGSGLGLGLGLGLGNP